MMRRTPRFLVVALPVVFVAAAFWLRPAFLLAPSGQPATIEPTLPLIVDLRALPADPARGEPPRLEAILDASSDLQDVSFSLVLPDGVSGARGALSGERANPLRAGERRAYVVPIQVLRPGEFPIRLQVSFRLPDGRVLHTQQGILWRSGVKPPQGRHHAGAYEWMGVPVGEPLP